MKLQIDMMDILNKATGDMFDRLVSSEDIKSDLDASYLVGDDSMSNVYHILKEYDTHPPTRIGTVICRTGTNAKEELIESLANRVISRIKLFNSSSTSNELTDKYCGKILITSKNIDKFC